MQSPPSPVTQSLLDPNILLSIMKMDKLVSTILMSVAESIYEWTDKGKCFRGLAVRICKYLLHGSLINTPP
jgi:hypothetical protein